MTKYHQEAKKTVKNVIGNEGANRSKYVNFFDRNTFKIHQNTFIIPKIIIPLKVLHNTFKTHKKNFHNTFIIPIIF